MKKLSVILLLITAAIGAKAQVLFKNGLKPNTVYTTNREMTMLMNMNPPEALAAKMGGTTMAMNMVMNSTNTISTSAKNSSGQIPLTFTSKVGENKMTMNGHEMPANMIAADQMLITGYGKYDGTKIMIDSVPGKVMNDSLRKLMNQIIDQASNISKFPDHPLKVGDTFTGDAPFTMPLPGIGSSQSPMDIKSTFKLVSLNGTVGVFDVTMSMSMNLNQAMQGQNLGVTMNGLGTGSMTFDAKNEYYSTMDMKITLDFDINSGGMDIKGKGNMSMSDKVAIASK